MVVIKTVFQKKYCKLGTKKKSLKNSPVHSYTDLKVMRESAIVQIYDILIGWLIH
jgi:hypothetical protein